VGLIGDQAWNDYLAKQERAKKLADLLEKTRISGEMLEQIEKAQQERLAAQSARSSSADEEEAALSSPAENANGNGFAGAVGSTLAQLLKRPEVAIEDLAQVVRAMYPEFFTAAPEVGFSVSGDCSGADPSPSPQKLISDGQRLASASVRDDTYFRERSSIQQSAFRLSAAARNEMKTVETEIKYAGYLDQQKKSIERLKKAEQRVIPEWFDYGKVSGLSREMNEKLKRVRPRTLGQASRIPGVTPAAVSLINVYIEIQGKQVQAQAAVVVPPNGI
jgi:tRNA uridine 5-carboxymethylaminomethyl modification enzyme